MTFNIPKVNFDPLTGEQGGASKDPITIQNPSGGTPAKLQPQIVGQALDVLKGVDGFGDGRLEKPDGTILARDSPLEAGVVFGPNVSKGGPISMLRCYLSLSK
jgi:hypothetical protein